MHLLLTNDDGIRAPGILALAEGMLSAGHRISVCAPDRERSAASHAATIGRPLRAVPTDFPGAERAWAVDGTPCDCASLGLWLTRDDPVDMVVAGINNGMNMGGACVYSGTVGAALEAAMCGVQAIAVSLCVLNFDLPSDFSVAARLAARVTDWAREHPLPLGTIYNLNVPALPYAALRGIVPAKLAPSLMGTPVYAPLPGDSYRFRHNAGDQAFAPDSDVSLSEAGYATITKLTWDFRLNADDAELAEIEL